MEGEWRGKTEGVTGNETKDEIVSRLATIFKTEKLTRSKFDVR